MTVYAIEKQLFGLIKRKKELKPGDTYRQIRIGLMTESQVEITVKQPEKGKDVIEVYAVRGGDYNNPLTPYGRTAGYMLRGKEINTVIDDIELKSM